MATTINASTLRLAALEVAKTQIGQKENPLGSNWGEPVKSYLASVGITFPASWCMSLVYWCFKQAANKLGVPNTAIKTGGVLNAWNSAPKTIKSLIPEIGAVVIFDHGHGLGHTGIVENFDKDFIYTIEGNTNLDGSRNGTTVERKKRSRIDKTLKGYIIY